MAALKIREAFEGDFAFVQDLMAEALTPYYGGDHRAHAARIFHAHLAGGRDGVGHFSSLQRLFIITKDGEPVGLVNIVGKRQGTWKISPLIVTESARDKLGYGIRLLRFAERYARGRGARQMYCTVAETNTSALNFFLRHGYVVAGRARGQYRRGVVEKILYKHLIKKRTRRETPLGQMKVIPLEVVPFVDEYAEQIRSLILKKLPAHFRGVDDAWVDALVRGYQRRSSHDVNQKYKLIFVVLNRQDAVLGVAVATPKKGGAVKIMPCVAENIAAFEVLLVGLPGFLKEQSRKLYLHCMPTVAETRVIQRLGWIIEALLPRAYHKHHVTQQWSLMLDKSDAP